MFDPNIEIKNIKSQHSIKTQTGIKAWVYKKILQSLLKSLGSPPLKIALWNNVSLSPPDYQFEIQIHSKATLWHLYFLPDLFLSDAYIQADISIEDGLVELLECICFGRTQKQTKTKCGYLKRKIKAITNYYQSKQAQLKRNPVQHQYDLSFNFYQLWLDQAHLQTSCAYFSRPEFNLEQAQIAKMDYLFRKLQLSPGQTVVEAGCGWGGLACYLAKTYETKIRSYSLSHEQIVFARERAKSLHLEHLVEFVEADYREIVGQYDVFISLEISEQIDINQYSDLHQVINRCLKPKGRGLIHSITHTQKNKSNPWLDCQAFPGVKTPNLKQITGLFDNDFSILDMENLRLHYAETLSHWLQGIEVNVSQINSKYNHEFFRRWQFYIAASVAAFTTGHLQLYQILFVREENNELPWSRDYLYK